MDRADALNGLDDRPWADLHHAFGAAEDLPTVLRSLAGDDPEAADEALDELYESILHQGTVYAATAEAVPFLARLAMAGHRPADLLVLLGGIAESGDEHEVAPGACRAAVATQLPAILGLTGAEEAQVRRAAVWAAGHTAAPAEAWPALERRWEEEHDEGVRAELVTALVRLDAARGTAAAVACLGPQAPARLRVTAVLACLAAGVAWDAAQHQAVLGALPADGLVSEFEECEPLQAVVAALLRRDTDEDREAAFALLEDALRIPARDVRAEAVWAADHACRVSRSAPARLLPSLLPLLDDPESAHGVVALLGKVAEQAGTGAAALARLASADGDVADHALAALATAAPDLAVPLLAEHLPQRPRALATASGARAHGKAASIPLPYDAALLDAVRQRLAEQGPSGNEPIHLALLLASWGRQAAPAVPELLDALPRIPLAGPIALAAVCPVDGELRTRTEDHLREAALRGPEDGRLSAARALHELTGDTGPLLTVIRAELAGDGRRLREAARLIGTLGEAAGELEPDVRAALRERPEGRSLPRADADAELAAALWDITGDAATAVQVLDAVIRADSGPWTRWTALRAARLAARMGPAARPLRPALEQLLATPLHAPAAVLALLAALPEEDLRGPLDRTALAGPVLDAAESDIDADNAFEALAALGPAALTDEHLHRLTALANRDRRVVTGGIEDQIIRNDEHLAARARATLSTLTSHPPLAP
ncbi:HEAT repeat domain-containing protein [Streptomyces aurantiogriseus]|uniref:PBS lyase n=1 Tax=Streptomyces aurantiogriseus TaxID=66870 RepID=A0A918C882_9ACTN|nr:HEAT repeat domain-containing protein [Streptomyces aurantiogriseus]GGR10142.1 hypothetical protein GCM10010251_27490 [Streptomyces aurantiogriseus]